MNDQTRIPRLATAKDEAGDVTFWRYSIPPEEDGFCGWGIFLLDSTGTFCAITDYGNYAFRWTAFGNGDFRLFVRSLGSDYLLCKLSNEEYDGRQTAAHIREYIDEAVKEGDMTQEQAADERDAIESHDDLQTAFDFNEWLRDTEIQDAWEMQCRSYPAQARCFGERLFSRLVDVIEAQLKDEGVLASD